MWLLTFLAFTKYTSALTTQSDHLSVHGLGFSPFKRFFLHSISNTRDRIRRSTSEAAEDAAPLADLDNQTQTPDMTHTPVGTGNGTDSGANPAPGFIPNDPTVKIGVNCSDLYTGRDNKCWVELNLSQWVQIWVTSHRVYCSSDEAFASCFLRLEGFWGLDCTGIKIESCGEPQPPAGVSPEVFYVAYNIHGMCWEE